VPLNVGSSQSTVGLVDLREIFGGKPAFISEIGPVIGAHVGPGLIGLGAISWPILDAG